MPPPDGPSHGPERGWSPTGGLMRDARTGQVRGEVNNRGAVRNASPTVGGKLPPGAVDAWENLRTPGNPMPPRVAGAGGMSKTVAPAATTDVIIIDIDNTENVAKETPYTSSKKNTSKVGHKPPDQAPKRDQKTKTRTPPNRTSTNQADPGSEIVNGGFPHGATLNKVNPNEDATDGQNPNGVVPYEEIINKYVSRIVELVTPRLLEACETNSRLQTSAGQTARVLDAMAQNIRQTARKRPLQAMDHVEYHDLQRDLADAAVLEEALRVIRRRYTVDNDQDMYL